MSSIDSGFTAQERAESSESASVSSSNTPSNAPKNNRHTLEFKNNVILWYESNSFNKALTAKKFKISRSCVQGELMDLHEMTF